MTTSPVKCNTALVACLMLTACAGLEDEFKVHELQSGGYEMTLPYNPSLAAWEATGLPIDTLVTSGARELCPEGYDMKALGLRQRPKYRHPERVWFVRCKPNELK